MSPLILGEPAEIGSGCKHQSRGVAQIKDGHKVRPIGYKKKKKQMSKIANNCVMNGEES